ncbi:MAG: hypothetical protein GZ086_08870 [Gelidibacter sp.]|nr:hypothetical protein [Gelidibacter sp.]
MKHLKKLSVVLMMTTLFSVSFTSCIDNEVSPLVEAIYEAQADLIAAQASVQNAEAALLLAQANAVEAQAAADAQVNADLAAGQLAILLANAGLTDAQAAMIMAQAEALADMTAAQVLSLIANAGLTDAQAAMIIAQADALTNMTAAQVLGLVANAGLTNAQAAMILAQSQALADMTAAQVLGLIAEAGFTDAQAAMILAEAEALANMTDAQVAQMLANAGYTNAETAFILAEIARYEAQTAHYALVQEQALLVLIAQTNLQVSAAENALALAEVAFQAQMAAAIAAMEAAGAQLAVGYAWDYAYAMNHANSLMYQLLDAQADLAQAELMQNGSVSWEFYLAQLEGEVAIAEAEKADLITAIAAMEAYIANPSTPEAMLSGLKADNDDLQAQMDAKEIEMQVQYNVIMAIYDENGVRNELVDRYIDSKDELDDAIAEKQDRLDDIEDAESDIEFWQLALTNYPAALAALQLTKNNATTAKNTAQGVYNTASTTQTTANNAQIAAAAALTTLEGELATLYGSLQTAANNLANEQAIYDAGIGTATSNNNTAISDITAAGVALSTAQTNYTTWKTRFEGSVGVDNFVNGGYYWVDPTSPSTMLGDMVLGNHTGANGVPSATYVRVESWTYNDLGPAGASPEDTYSPLTIGAAQQATLGAGQLPIAGNGAITPGEYATTYPLLGYTLAFYVEVGLDDVVYNNLVQMNLAIAALGDEDVFDNPPMFGDAQLVGTDAYTNLWNAQLAQLGTQDTLDNFGDNLADAQEDYDYWQNLYENELVLLDAAQAALATANTNLTAANTAKASALSTLNLAITAENNAITALNNFLLTSEDDYQDWIDAAILDIADWNAEIAAIEPIIAAKQAVVDSLQADYDAYIANEGVLSGLYADLHAQIIAEWQAYWVLEQEFTILENAWDLNDDLIDAYGSADDLSTLNAELDQLKLDLIAANLQIEVATQALATAQVEEMADEAYISYLEALIDTLEQRHANTLAIAAKYKALMDAALAS